MNRPVECRNRILRFRLGDAWFGIRLEYVSGLLGDGPIRKVAGTPAPVLGLGRYRGHLLTVLDLPALLKIRPESNEVCLIRLNGANRNTALRVPSKVRMESFEENCWRRSSEDAPGTEGEIEQDGRRITLLNPEAFVSRLEMEIQARDRSA